MMEIKEAIEKYRETSGNKLTPKAVLFDMDGVLFDSMGNHTLSWRQAMLEQGIDRPQAEYYLFEGATGSFTINRLFQIYFERDATEEEKAHIYGRKSAHFNALPKAEPMPFAFELLNKVKENGLTPVLVTGSGQKSLLDRLNIHFPGIFDQSRMVTAYDVKQGKPHPEPYLQGLQKAGVAAHEAIVVENAPLGVQSAIAAHIFTVAVNTGPIDEAILINDGANLLYNSIEELYSNWDQIMNA